MKFLFLCHTDLDNYILTQRGENIPTSYEEWPLRKTKNSKPTHQPGGPLG